jgi:hypothetical protein
MDSKMEFVLNAEKVLMEAAREDFEAVIVFGLKDGIIHARVSAVDGRLEVLGALEAAKMALWEAGDD